MVADVTILPNRAQRVDFSTPYLRRVKYDGDGDIWIFLKPFTLDLWLTVALSCLFIGVVILILEHRANDPGKLEKVIWFPFGSLVFAESKVFILISFYELFCFLSLFVT